MKLDGVSEHEGCDTLELFWSQILLELLQVALKGLLIDQRELTEHWWRLLWLLHRCVCLGLWMIDFKSDLRLEAWCHCLASA